MNYLEERKSKIIVNVLLNYFFSKGAKDIDISIKSNNNDVHIIVSADVKISTSDEEELRLIMKPKRLPEYDNYYEELLGVEDTKNSISDLDGLSAIIDDCIITYNNEKLTIAAIRKI